MTYLIQFIIIMATQLVQYSLTELIPISKRCYKIMI